MPAVTLDRDPDQVGVGELLARPQVAVVEEDVEPRPVEGGGSLLADLLRALQHHEVDIVRGHGARPDDSLVVVLLLDDRRHHAARADPVAAAEERLLLAVLVEERRVEAVAVLVGEIEDVADLDRGLEGERAAALGAPVALDRLAQIGEPRLEVAPRLDTAKVEAVLVRAGDELAVAQRLVGDDLAGEADRAERAARGAERGADLLVRRRTRADLAAPRAASTPTGGRRRG